MAVINSYLSFDGNCREAMQFYKQCLGGDLVLQTIGESPLCEQLPKKMKNYILHASLTSGSLVLMGSDMLPDSGLVRGNSVTLVLQCDSEAEIRGNYENLAMGGRITHPVALTYWGALFGTLTDKFGIHWMLNFEQVE